MSRFFSYQSKGVDLKLVPECANITRPSCDLTHEWHSLAEMYLLWVIGSRGSTTLVNCMGQVYLPLESEFSRFSASVSP